MRAVSRTCFDFTGAPHTPNTQHASPTIVSATRTSVMNDFAICDINTCRSQITVASSRKPMNCLKVSIHAPGFGRYLSKAGKNENNKYGNATPSASIVKIMNACTPDCVKANPNAGPINGPVHGVATKVANTPLKKEPEKPLLPCSRFPS